LLYQRDNRFTAGNFGTVPLPRRWRIEPLRDFLSSLRHTLHAPAEHFSSPSNTTKNFLLCINGGGIRRLAGVVVGAQALVAAPMEGGAQACRCGRLVPAPLSDRPAANLPRPPLGR
jgi:hypothetical protein